jgi:potassium channel subfamily K, other eukaryote
MYIYETPVWPIIWSQGYWHAVMASILYLIGCLMLSTNMLGYFRGKYPQQFDLDDDQRTLILQTMMFFFWLAAGAAAFSAVEGWTYANALYWCDVVCHQSFSSFNTLG